MSHGHEPRKLPLVLGLEEVTRLLQSAGMCLLMVDCVDRHAEYFS
jgi:hypothetical protein